MKHSGIAGWDDTKMEGFIGILLRVGVLASALVVLLGGILYLARYGGTIPDYRIFRGEPARWRSALPIMKSALSVSSGGIIQAGLLLLIATPVARVVFSVFAFALQRDRTYVFVTLIVLGILLYSLMGGRL
jgi:uncharacterized membrane protein